MKSDKKYSAPALEKGLDILELLSEQEFGLGQVEIARALGRSVGEIFRMLVVLQDRGYVTLEPGSDRYVLTTFLFEVAHRIPLVRRLTAVAGPLMRRLAVEINQSVHLAIVSGTDVLVIGQIESPGNNIMSVRLGAKIEIWQASSGRVILAHWTRQALQEMVDKAPMPKGMKLAVVMAEIEAIRKLGYEVMDSFVVGGVVNISAPIFDHSGDAIAALTVPHIDRFGSDLSFNDCRDRLVGAARKLTKSLGGSAALVSAGAAPQSEQRDL